MDSKGKVSHRRRKLHFLFKFPGLVEAIASRPSIPHSVGYADIGVWDLQVDRDLKTNRAFAWLSNNFEIAYPLVILGLHRSPMNNELFDVPQASLYGVPLHLAFSWAYYHFILQDGKRLPKNLAAAAKRKPRDLARTVLTFSLRSL